MTGQHRRGSDGDQRDALETERRQHGVEIPGEALERQPGNAALGESGTTKIEIDDGEVARKVLDGATMQGDLPVQREVIDMIREEHHHGGPFAQRVKCDANPVARCGMADGRQRHGGDYMVLALITQRSASRHTRKRSLGNPLIHWRRSFVRRSTTLPVLSGLRFLPAPSSLSGWNCGICGTSWR